MPPALGKPRGRGGFYAAEQMTRIRNRPVVPQWPGPAWRGTAGGTGPGPVPRPGPDRARHGCTTSPLATRMADVSVHVMAERSVRRILLVTRFFDREFDVTRVFVLVD